MDRSNTERSCHIYLINQLRERLVACTLSLFLCLCLSLSVCLSGSHVLTTFAPTSGVFVCWRKSMARDVQTYRTEVKAPTACRELIMANCAFP